MSLQQRSQFLVKAVDNKLEVYPAEIDKLQEYTVFDALRDNDGKPIKAGDIVEAIDNLDALDE